MSHGKKHGKGYVTRAGRAWGLSQTRIVYKCAAEAQVSEKIARDVLFRDAPIISTARERAYRWGIANRVIQTRREREQADYIAKAKAEAEERDAERRVADAVAEENPSNAFDHVLARIEEAERLTAGAEARLSSDVVRRELEQRVRELEARKA